MIIDDSRREAWETMQRDRRRGGSEPELPLQGAGGGGTSGGMEARIAKLEASMDYVKAELGRLSGLPAELARIGERLHHLPTRAETRADMEGAIDRSGAAIRQATADRFDHVPTKAEMKDPIEQAVDRAGARTQRTVAIVGGLVTIAVALLTYAPRLAGLLH